MQINDIINSLNVISQKLFNAVETQIYQALDNIINISPKILTQEPLKNIFFKDKINGIILIANSFILFYIVYFILIQLISIYNGKQIPNIYFFIVKVIVITLIVNNSYFLCELSLEFIDALTDAISMYGKDIAGQNICFESLKETILSIDDLIKSELISLNGLIKGVISFGIVTILINFSIRYVTIIFLIIVSPFAIMSNIADITGGLFKSWIRMYTSNLFMQIVIKLILIIPLMYKDKNSVMYKIILVGSIYLIYRVAEFTKELFLQVNQKLDIKNHIT